MQYYRYKIVDNLERGGDVIKNFTLYFRNILRKGNFMKRKITFLLSILIFIGLLFGGSIYAQDWPEEPVTMIVPFGTGGTTDRLARMMGPYMEKELGEPFLIENRSGGGGMVGTQAYHYKEPADGSYLLYTLQPYLSGSIFRGAEYNMDDFNYLGVTYYSVMGIWVNPNSEYDSLSELLNDINENSGSVKAAYIPTSWSEVAITILQKRLDSEIRMVPYDGGAEQRMAVISGDVDFTVTEVHGTLAAAKGDMKCLGVFAEEKVDAVPETPTVNSQLAKMGRETLPEMSNFRFIMVKKPFKEDYPERWDILVEAFKNALQNPELKAQAAEQSLAVVWKGPEEAAEAMENSHELLTEFKEFWQN